MTLIVDTHAHFTPEAVARRPHDAAGDPVLAGLPPHLSDTDLLALLDAAGVDKLLQVTPSVMRFDNTHSLEVARREPDRVRVIASLDHGAPDAPQRLRALAAEDNVVGVRVMFLGSDRSLLDGDALEPLWQAAAEAPIPVSVYAPRCAAALARVAGRHPELEMVVDHACVDLLPATPTAERFDGWSDVFRLAPLDNVWIKVSGLPEASEERFPYPAAQERLRQLRDAFPATRLMWASNHPPSARAGSYADSLEWVRASDVFSGVARDAVLGGTAARVFRLPWTD